MINKILNATKLERTEFGIYEILDLDIHEYLDIIGFSDEEIIELKKLDPRLSVEPWDTDVYWLAVYGKSDIHYYSLGDYCYAFHVNNNTYDDVNGLQFIPSAFIIMDGFEALKQKVLEYSYLKFS